MQAVSPASGVHQNARAKPHVPPLLADMFLFGRAFGREDET